MDKYEWVTQEMFDEELEAILDEQRSDLLQVPGAYEVFSEYFNNEILDRLKEKREQR